MSSQSAARADAAKASKPCVCSVTNAASIARAVPAASARSSVSITTLHIPSSAAMSPPGSTCRYCVLMRVLPGVSMSKGDCGLSKATRPLSRSGLKVTMGTPRRLASCSSWSRRGLETPTFWPKKKIASALSKSVSATVPTGEPIVFGKATDVLSWHMFELSGRLLVP